MVWDNPWWERFLDEPWAIRGVEDKAAPWTLFYNLYATPAKLACLVKLPTFAQQTEHYQVPLKAFAH